MEGEEGREIVRKDFFRFDVTGDVSRKVERKRKRKRSGAEEIAEAIGERRRRRATRVALRRLETILVVKEGGFRIEVNGPRGRFVGRFIGSRSYGARQSQLIPSGGNENSIADF